MYYRKYLLKISAALMMVLPVLSNAQGPTSAYIAEKAIDKNYDLANKELGILSDQETKKAIQDAFLPKVEINGKYAYLNSHLNIDLPSASIPLINLPLFEGSTTFRTSSNLWMTDLSTSMLLYSGGKVPKLNKAVDQKIKGQQFMLEKDRQEIIDQVSVAYDQLSLLKQVNVVLTESEKRLEEEKKTAKKAFEYGLITSFEVNKIEVAQAALDAKKQEYTGKRTLLLSQLHQLSGISLAELMLIDEDLTTFSLLGVENTINNRPEVNALDAAIKANRFNVEAAKTHWIPKIQAMASARYIGLTNTKFNTPYHAPTSGEPINFAANKLEAFPAYFVGVGFKWDIFDGFQGKREVRKANIAVQQAENTKKQAIELLNLNLQKAQVDFETANKQLEAGKKRKEIVLKALTIAIKEYHVGLIKPSERIVAENDYQQAALDYLQAVFNQRRAAINYLKATGTLTVDKLR